VDQAQDNRLSHVDAAGKASMVDVSGKQPTLRRAVAEGHVRVSEPLAQAIAANTLAKGDLLGVARIAGIQAAKRTDELIPLCHPLPLEQVVVEVRLEGTLVRIRAEARTSARTGVEMEALTAVSVAALTVIDMGKAIDPLMTIEQVQLVEKTGGKRDIRRGAQEQP
jgi:cyclic pyranopterin monophosphate synthase